MRYIKTWVQTGIRYLHILVAVKCFLSSCVPPSFLAQIFLHDVKNMQMKFNPRRADFVKLVSPHLPTVEQLATVAEDKNTLQLCKTGRHCLVTMVISFSCSNTETCVWSVISAVFHSPCVGFHFGSDYHRSGNFHVKNNLCEKFLWC